MRYYHFSAIIFSTLSLDTKGKQQTYALLLSMHKRFIAAREQHPLFNTIITCCSGSTEIPYLFKTELYPVYLIFTKYIEILDLEFCSVEYVSL